MVREMRSSRRLVVLALVVGAAGCTGDDRTSGSAPAPSTTLDVALAAQVPAPIRSAGLLVAATDPIYEPSEFQAGDKTVTGFDVDLFKAVAGKLALKTQWKTVKFDDIIAGVGADRYQV